MEHLDWFGGYFNYFIYFTDFAFLCTTSHYRDQEEESNTLNKDFISCPQRNYAWIQIHLVDYLCR